MGFVDLVTSIGWWPIPTAAIVGFVAEYVLGRSILVLHAWPWDTSKTAGLGGAAVGLLFGVISLQIRPIIFTLSVGELIGFVPILAFVSLLAASFGAIVASVKRPATLTRTARDASYASTNEIFVLGHKFRRMTETERKRLNYTLHHPDIFIWWPPSLEGVEIPDRNGAPIAGYIVYEPTDRLITDTSDGYRSTKFKYWLGSPK
jgi:hypothetical protein